MLGISIMISKDLPTAATGRLLHLIKAYATFRLGLLLLCLHKLWNLVFFNSYLLPSIPVGLEDFCDCYVSTSFGCRASAFS